MVAAAGFGAAVAVGLAAAPAAGLEAAGEVAAGLAGVEAAGLAAAGVAGFVGAVGPQIPVPGFWKIGDIPVLTGLFFILNPPGPIERSFNFGLVPGIDGIV